MKIIINISSMISDNLIGKKIYELRKAKLLSLDELSKLAKVSKSYIWDLENNKDANPSLDTVCGIAVALGVTMDYLLNDRALTREVFEKALYLKFNILNDRDKIRIEQIIDNWLKEY